MSGRVVAEPPVIPGLVFVDVLGMGGFADVFRYEQLGRHVAVKVLTTDLSRNTQQAFEAEANLMARLSTHPAIVSIYQAGAASDGRSFLVMEVCQPKHLGARLRQKTFAVGKALEVTVQIAGAVESAHRLGVLHRDIKPANILFTEFGRPALTDFGISVSRQDGEQGLGVGVSPAWAPPEQLRSGAPMGPASDVYSLAATCWAMLVGRSPFETVAGPNDALSVTKRVRQDPVPPTRREGVPESLERVLAVAMAKDPSHRYASALEFGRALQAVQTSLHLPSTPIEVGEDTAYDDLDDDDLDEDVSHEFTRLTGFVEEAERVASAAVVPPSPVSLEEESDLERASGLGSAPVPEPREAKQSPPNHEELTLRKQSSRSRGEPPLLGRHISLEELGPRASDTLDGIPSTRRRPRQWAVVGAMVVLVLSAAVWGVSAFFSDSPRREGAQPSVESEASNAPKVSAKGSVKAVSFAWQLDDPLAGEKPPFVRYRIDGDSWRYSRSGGKVEESARPGQRKEIDLQVREGDGWGHSVSASAKALPAAYSFTRIPLRAEGSFIFPSNFSELGVTLRHFPARATVACSGGGGMKGYDNRYRTDSGGNYGPSPAGKSVPFAIGPNVSLNLMTCDIVNDSKQKR